MSPTADRQIRLLLVDDHALVREGLRALLTLESDLAVVGEAADSDSAVHAAARLRPDVVLLDVQIPGQRAPYTVRQIHQVAPEARVVVLSMHDGTHLVRELIAAGIRGYLLKSVDAEELLAAIRNVYRNPGRMVLSISASSMTGLQAVGGDNPLSERELDVLRLTARALSNSQIASRLEITEATVKRHLHSIFGKLGAVSRIDAVNKAIASSLLPARDEPSHRRGL